MGEEGRIQLSVSPHLIIVLYICKDKDSNNRARELNFTLLDCNNNMTLMTSRIIIGLYVMTRYPKN